MPLICDSVTVYVAQQVLKPVDTWVAQQSVECKKLPWWDPRKWLCWIVTTFVKVVVWVTETIIVPITQTVCRFVTWVIGAVLLPFAVAVDAVCSRCTAADWVRDHFIHSLITFRGKVELPGTAGSWEYTFRCNCSASNKPVITIVASTDEQAADMAKAECERKCA